MKKICAVLITAMLILTAGQALAYSYSGVWNVNDIDKGDFFALTFATIGGSATFYIYDGTPTDNLALLGNGSTSGTVWFNSTVGLNSKTVYIFENNSNWYANFTKDDLTGAFSLGATPDFMFMFSDTNCNGDITSYDVVLDGEDSYVLTANCATGAPIMTVIVSDVTPVPIPGAFILLGSGLLGLLGIRRRAWLG
jgi:hypothetical protein